MSRGISKQSLVAFSVIFLITFVYQLFMAYSLTPLTVNEGFDSLVFKQMGLTLLQGKTLYIDLFDHKGPIIYFINGLAQFIIPGKIGLFVAYVFYISIVTFLWYKTALLFIKDRKKAILPVIATIFALLWVNNEGGNLTEDWSLLPITYSLYVFAKYFVSGKDISNMEFFLIGISMGIITFLRINNMIAICCEILVYIIILIREKRYQDFLKILICLFAGWSVIAVFCFGSIYALYGTDGVSAMLYGTFVFNFEYMAAPQAMASDGFIWYTLYGCVAALLLFFLYKQYGNCALSNLLCLSFIGTVLAIGTKGWCNYFIIFTPLIALSLCAIYGNLSKRIRVLLLVFFVLFIPYNAIKRSKIVYDKTYVAFIEQADEVMKEIPQLDHGNIWNNADFTGLTVLQRNHVTQANRVIIPFQLEVSDKLKQDEIKRFETEKPQWVFLSKPAKEVNTDFYNIDRIKTYYDLYRHVKGGKNNLYVYKKTENW